MDGFEKRKTQSKEAILKVALELFEQHGFSRVCIPEIARQAGVSSVTVYNHFGNKEELIKEIFKVFLDNLLDSYRKIIEAKMPFEEKLETLFFSQEAFTQQYQGELMETSAKRYPVVQEYIDDYWGEQRDNLIGKLLAEGKAGGYIRPDLSLQVFFFYYQIVRRGVYAIPNIAERMLNKPHLMPEVISVAIHGLRG